MAGKGVSDTIVPGPVQMLTSYYKAVYYSLVRNRGHSSMTRQIKSSDTLGNGIPLVQIRNFFQFIRAWHHEDFSLETLAQRLRLDIQLARKTAGHLVAEGYAEEQGTGYMMTDKGLDLMRASAASKISRKTATRALDDLLQRVQQINADPEKIDTIAAVAVFGSYLSDQDPLGDLDVAIKIVNRYPERDRADTALEYARKSGRNFGSFLEGAVWHHTELLQMIKARKRTISLQLWHSFLELAAAPGFRYSIVFGNADDVAQEIAEPRAKAATIKKNRRTGL